MTVFIKIVTGILFVFVSINGRSQEFYFKDESGIALLNPHVKILVDQSDTLTIADITEGRNIEFSEASLQFPEFDVRTFWVKMSLRTENEQAATLVIEDVTLDRIELFVPEGERWSETVNGFSIPMENKPVFYEGSAFQIRLKNKPVTCYLRFRGKVLPPVYLINQKWFLLNYTIKKNILLGIVIGAVMLNMLISLVQFLFRKKIIYILYFVTCLSIMCYTLAMYGYTTYVSAFLYSHMHEFGIMASLFSQLSVLIFGMVLLEIKKESGPIYYVSSFFAALLSSIIVILCLSGFNKLLTIHVLSVAQLTALLLTVICVWLGAHALRRKGEFQVVAKYYLACYILLLILTVFEVLHLSFGLSNYLFIDYVTIGFLFEAVGIGIALNIKIKVELEISERKAVIAQNEKVFILENMKVALENRVEERTEELSNTISKLASANSQLTEALHQTTILKDELSYQSRELDNLNRWKTRLFGIFSHDLMSPVASLSSLIVLIELDKWTKPEFEHAKTQIKTQLKGLTDTMTNILKWIEAQMRGDKANPVTFSLNHIVGKVSTLLIGSSAVKGIEIINEVPPETKVFADVNQIETVIRNLVSNAIKFSYRNSRITINSQSSDVYVTLNVIDSGIGINDDDDPFRFNGKSRDGTNNEKGIGLGLVMCKEFVLKNKGKIGAYNNDNGVGSTFSFTIPITNME